VEVKIVRELDAPVDALWAVLGKFGDLSWVPGPEKVEVIGSGPGMRRRLYMPGGAEPFDEVLVAQDDQAKKFVYDIPKCAMIPFDDYRAEVSLTALGNHRARLVWESRFDNGSTPADQARAMIEGAYNMMIDALAARVA